MIAAERQTTMIKALSLFPGKLVRIWTFILQMPKQRMNEHPMKRNFNITHR